MPEIKSFHSGTKLPQKTLISHLRDQINALDPFTKSFLAVFLILIALTPLIIASRFIFGPHAATNHMKIALRVANSSILDALQPYRNGTKGNVSFIYYGDLNTLQIANSRGYTTGNNPVELSDTITCDSTAPDKIMSNLQTYRQYNVTGVLLDCEYGDDHFWGDPDLPQIASTIHSRLQAVGSDLKIQVSMQFGLLENKLKVTGSTCYTSPSSNASTLDCYLCSNPRDASSCRITESYASQTWHNYDTNDIIAVFGRSGAQDSVAGFIATNTIWMNYVKTTFPNNAFWVVSGLWDKPDRNGVSDGIVDLNPSILGDIAIQAESMGVKALAIYWAGDTPADLFGPTTEMDVFLDKWAAYVGTPVPSITLTATPTYTPSPTPTQPPATPTPSPSVTPTPTAIATPTPTVTDTKSPAVTIISPNNGSFVRAGSNVTIQANAKDDVAIARVEFYVDGLLKCTDTIDPYACSFTSSTTIGISQNILVRAYDAAGNNASVFVTITTKK